MKQGAEPGSSAASHPHVLGQALSQSCKGLVTPRPGLDLCPLCRPDGVGSWFRGSPAAVAIAVCLGLAAVSETLCANQVLRNRGTVPRAWSQHKHLCYLMVCSWFYRQIFVPGTVLVDFQRVRIWHFIHITFSIFFFCSYLK